MYEHKLPRLLTCSMGIMMEIMGGKWKPCLIYNIRNGLRRPSELHRHLPGATPRVLNQQLRELEAHGLVHKVIYPVLPPKAEYFLTPLGESLLPIIDSMTDWGDTHGQRVAHLGAVKQKEETEMVG